jgi:hypothetical protein
MSNVSDSVSAEAGTEDFLAKLAESSRVASLIEGIQGDEVAVATESEESAALPACSQPIGPFLRSVGWRGKKAKRQRQVARNKAAHIGDPWTVAVGDLLGAMSWRGGKKQERPQPVAVAADEAAPAAKKSSKRQRDVSDIAW